MAKKKKGYTVGFRKPPKGSQFKPGKSGNRKGRPKGSKNLSSAIEKELNDRVAVSENGKQKKLSKGALAVKQLVNKAVSGDLKAAQTLFKIIGVGSSEEPSNSPLDVFDTPEHHFVMADICRRIRAMKELPSPSDFAIASPTNDRR